MAFSKSMERSHIVGTASKDYLVDWLELLFSLLTSILVMFLVLDMP